MRVLRKVFLLAVSFLLLTYAFSYDNSLAASSCFPGGETRSKVELYFGLDIPGGGRVEPKEWDKFVEEQVTPKFPDGLTIDQILGQWQDATTGETIKEPSRVLMLIYSPSEKSEQAIEDIREAYKSQFRQDSVMRLDEINCVSF